LVFRQEAAPQQSGVSVDARSGVFDENLKTKVAVDVKFGTPAT